MKATLQKYMKKIILLQHVKRFHKEKYGSISGDLILKKEYYMNVVFNNKFNDDAAFLAYYTQEEEFRMLFNMRKVEMKDNTKLLDRYYFLS